MGLRYSRYTTEKPPVGAQIDWSHPLSRGLVGCYLMNEGGGNVVGDIARKNNGLNVGGVWQATKKGNSLYYNSTYTQIGNLPIFQAQTSTTIEAIFIPTSIANQQRIVFKTNNIGFEERSNQAVAFYTNIATDAYLDAPNSTLITGNIYHLIGTYNSASKVFYYKNLTSGVSGSVSTSGGAALSTTIYSMDIGRRGGLAQGYLIGNVILFRVWNRVLSPSEIQQLYVEPYGFVMPIRKRRWFIPQGEEPPVVGAGGRIWSKYW